MNSICKTSSYEGEVLFNANVAVSQLIYIQKLAKDYVEVA